MKAVHAILDLRGWRAASGRKAKHKEKVRCKAVKAGP